MTKPMVYVETTVVSYLTAWPSRDLVRAAQQRTTREWWEKERDRFELVTSEVVLIEVAAGDPVAAAQRAAALSGLPVLKPTDAAVSVANTLVARRAIPSVAIRDALHVGVCAVSGVDFLLTWNFRHLANAALRRRIEETCEEQGYRAPVICAPDALLGEP